VAVTAMTRFMMLPPLEMNLFHPEGASLYRSWR
jgi:hypothetical protein